MNKYEYEKTNKISTCSVKFARFSRIANVGALNMALSALVADIKNVAEFPDAAHRGAVQYKVGVLRGQTRPNLDTRLKEKKMSSLTNTIIIFPTSVLAGVAAYVLTKDLGDLLSIEQRPLFRLRFAVMAACTAFCFISYSMWTVGVPFELAVFWPGGKTTYPWWVLPLTLGVSVLWYRTLSKNTTTFGER